MTEHRIYIRAKTEERFPGPAGGQTGIEITDDVRAISPIKSSFDYGEFDYGVFRNSNVNITLDNIRGRYSSPTSDSRSVFGGYRDGTMVSIYNKYSAGGSGLLWEGVVWDKSATQDMIDNTATIICLGPESVLDRTYIYPGTFLEGMTIGEVVKTLGSLPPVKWMFDVVDDDLTRSQPIWDNTRIKDPTPLANTTGKDVLNKLSVLLNAQIYVYHDARADKRYLKFQGRDRSGIPHSTQILYLNDPKGRDNLVRIYDYNNGAHRVYNILNLGNGDLYTDSVSRTLYGERSKTIDTSFLDQSDYTSKDLIAEELLVEFGRPKTELYVEVDNYSNEGALMTALQTSNRKPMRQQLSIMPYLRAMNANPLAQYGADRYGQSVYPQQVGPPSIPEYHKFHTVSWNLDLTADRTVVKLRRRLPTDLF